MQQNLQNLNIICKNLVYRSQCNLIKRIIIVLGKNFFCNSGKLLLVPYTKDFGIITRF